MEYFIHFSLSLLLLARWNHQKILRWVIFFVPRERADATKQYREIFFFVCIYYFLTSLSSSRGPILCIVGCVYGRLIAAAAADGNVCLLMLMPHRPGQNPKIPAALTSSYQPPDKKEYTCSLSKSACGNGCAIYNSSIYIDGSPSFVKGKCCCCCCFFPAFTDE